MCLYNILLYEYFEPSSIWYCSDYYQTKSNIICVGPHLKDFCNVHYGSCLSVGLHSGSCSLWGLKVHPYIHSNTYRLSPRTDGWTPPPLPRASDHKGKRWLPGFTSPENRMKPFGFYYSIYSSPGPQSGSESLFYVFSCFPPPPTTPHTPPHLPTPPPNLPLRKHVEPLK